MIVLGKRVIHATKGKGVIVQQENKTIGVKFDNEIITFAYPQVFYYLLRFTKKEDQDLIEKELEGSIPKSANDNLTIPKTQENVPPKNVPKHKETSSNTELVSFSDIRTSSKSNSNAVIVEQPPRKPQKRNVSTNDENTKPSTSRKKKKPLCR